MKTKHCPVCGNEEYALDVIEYGTGWIFCRNCFKSAKESGLFTKIDAAIKEAREYHKKSIIVEQTA